MRRTHIGILGLVFIFFALLVEYLRRSDDPCGSFILISGNLTGASLVFLSESHDKDKTKKSIACMEKLTEPYPQHKVLLEAVDYSDSIPCGELKIPTKPGRECWGVEQAEVLEKHEPYDRRMQLFVDLTKLRVIVEQSNKYGISEEEIEPLWKTRVAQVRTLLEKQAKDPVARALRYRSPSQYLATMYKEIAAERERGKPLAKIIQDKLSTLPSYDQSASQQMLSDRNQAIVEGALFHRGLFRVVIIGDAHANPQRGGPPAQKLLDSLENQDEGFAVLSMQ